MINKGSEWKRWDLHFHTPASYDYKDKAVTSRDIVEGMSRNGIAAFAVTDHHEIDTKKYKELKTIGEEYGVTVLPGIEFLSDSRGREPIHFIGVFSEACNVDYLWGQIKNKTNIHQIEGKSKKENEVYCNLEETITLIKELGGIVTIHAGDKSNSVENITHSLPHGSAQKIEIANSVDIYELGKESDQAGYKSVVFPAIGRKIPMIICSDNHNINDYQIKQKLWIKGSASFDGLKYALNEPEERFFIGDEPDVLKRVRDNKTKYISELRIVRTGREDPENVWFDDVKIPINHELVTIIGNKGSGKSALSDIFALCCDAEHSSDYLFLNKNKFKKKGLADRFTASVIFENSLSTEEKTLDSEVDGSQQPLVRYLPQSYFEKVCNEIGKVEAFRNEIEKVVFQYVPHEKKLQQSSFKDLVGFRKEVVEKEIYHLIERVHEVNAKIIDLEDKLDPGYKKNLVSKKKQKEVELKTHLNAKPEKIEDPTEKTNDPIVIERKEKLTWWSEEKNRIDTEIRSIKEKISNLLIQVEELQSIKRDLKYRFDELSCFVDEIIPKAEELGVNLKGAIDLRFDGDVISERIASIESQINGMKETLVEDALFLDKEYEDLSLMGKFQRSEHEVASIQGEFSGEQKVYQNYLDALKEWESVKKEIEGDDGSVGSLSYINKEIELIDKNIPKEVDDLRRKRVDVSLEIFRKKSEIKSIYDDVKNEIDTRLSGSNVTGLSIESSFYVEQDFEEILLGNIRQNRSGSFYGAEDGRAFLHESLVSQTNWNDTTSIEMFFEQLIGCLEEDKRSGGKGSKTFIGEIIKNRLEFYNYVFSLNYLNPHYDLRQNGKSLEQLSPGEKGALLLVFYLVLDKDDVPLIIDQPEDNLDNNSVAKVLVPFIREAKKNRQIIMVSHNPNLAVVSDSEQVIRVDIDKEAGNSFKYVCGGIEDKKINNEIVDVLEGTMPAFTKRKEKYFQ